MKRLLVLLLVSLLCVSMFASCNDVTDGALDDGDNSVAESESAPEVSETESTPEVPETESVPEEPEMTETEKKVLAVLEELNEKILVFLYLQQGDVALSEEPAVIEHGEDEPDEFYEDYYQVLDERFQSLQDVEDLVRSIFRAKEGVRDIPGYFMKKVTVAPAFLGGEDAGIWAPFYLERDGKLYQYKRACEHAYIFSIDLLECGIDTSEFIVTSYSEDAFSVITHWNKEAVEHYIEKEDGEWRIVDHKILARSIFQW